MPESSGASPPATQLLLAKSGIHLNEADMGFDRLPVHPGRVRDHGPVSKKSSAPRTQQPQQTKALEVQQWNRQRTRLFLEHREMLDPAEPSPIPAHRDIDPGALPAAPP